MLLWKNTIKNKIKTSSRSFGIWKEGCEVLFQNKTSIPRKQHLFILICIGVGEEEQKPTSEPASSSEFSPETCDAFYLTKSGRCGIVLVLRDFAGNF